MNVKMPPPLEMGHTFPGTLKRVMTQRSEFDPRFDNPTGLRATVDSPGM